MDHFLDPPMDFPGSRNWTLGGITNGLFGGLQWDFFGQLQLDFLPTQNGTPGGAQNGVCLGNCKLFCTTGVRGLYHFGDPQMDFLGNHNWTFGGITIGLFGQLQMDFGEPGIHVRGPRRARGGHPATTAWGHHLDQDAPRPSPNVSPKFRHGTLY